MSKSKNIIVFEYERIFTNKGEKRISPELYKQLISYHGNYSPFFNLIHNGIQFKEYVGILQVGNTTIEVLPKADKSDNKKKWRDLLIGMIQTIWGFEVKTTGSSDLNLKSNSILDLYFELYIKELEYLLHRGLIKKYNKKEGNLYALKGALQFSKHIAQNLTHQERFYVNYNYYDQNHTIHFILYKALKLIHELNNKVELKSRLGSLLLNFPEMQDIKITQSTFDRIQFDRKNQHYRKALQIAELILLNYHPDVKQGGNHVLALMFDMNLLWEQFVYIVLRKKLKDFKVKSQISKNFWKHSEGRKSSMKPDILIESKVNDSVIVLDTKWKNLNDKNPSPEDLRQMYVYHKYYKAQKTALIYPNEKSSLSNGSYYNIDSLELSRKTCGIIQISTLENFNDWNDKIGEDINTFLMINA